LLIYRGSGHFGKEFDDDNDNDDGGGYKYGNMAIVEDDKGHYR
jgi:hypothetical protein